jgi:hypothetical protein
MPAPLAVIEKKTALQYDGTNSAAILAFVNTANLGEDTSYSIISETGGILTMRSTWPNNFYDIGLAAGDYVLITFASAGAVPGDMFAKLYTVL